RGADGARRQCNGEQGGRYSVDDPHGGHLAGCRNAVILAAGFSLTGAVSRAAELCLIALREDNSGGRSCAPVSRFLLLCLWRPVRWRRRPPTNAMKAN